MSPHFLTRWVSRLLGCMALVSWATARVGVQRCQSGLKYARFVDPGQQNFEFSWQIFEKFQFFRQIFKTFRFYSGNFEKKFDFPRKNCSFTATSEQIILFLFKSHHFRTYLLYMIRYNNISRLVHDPPRPTQPKIWRVAIPSFPQPPGLTPLLVSIAFPFAPHISVFFHSLFFTCHWISFVFLLYGRCICTLRLTLHLLTF